MTLGRAKLRGSPKKSLKCWDAKIWKICPGLAPDGPCRVNLTSELRVNFLRFFDMQLSPFPWDMENVWLPQILRPDCTWPRPVAVAISTQTPTVPSPGRPFIRRLWGLLHRLLGRFSRTYCSWLSIRFNPHVMDLPFGLVLKWTDRVRPEEAQAMEMARVAGMPVPRVLCCGEHPNDFRRFSILMTRLPGYELCNSREPFDVESEGPWVQELGNCLKAMRAWKSQYGMCICSVAGTNISTQRVPNHSIGPFKTEQELHKYLLAPASSHGFESKEKYEEAFTLAKQLDHNSHRIVFTHGDFKPHNVLVDEDDHLSGFLDWECTGWCPEYWEFTTAMRFGRNSWWYQVSSHLSGDQYTKELQSDIALNRLTVDSYIGW